MGRKPECLFKVFPALCRLGKRQRGAPLARLMTTVLLAGDHIANRTTAIPRYNVCPHVVNHLSANLKLQLGRPDLLLDGDACSAWGLVHASLHDRSDRSFLDLQEEAVRRSLDLHVSNVDLLSPWSLVNVPSGKRSVIKADGRTRHGSYLVVPSRLRIKSARLSDPPPRVSNCPGVVGGSRTRVGVLENHDRLINSGERFKSDATHR